MNMTAEKTVRELALENTTATRVFEKLGIDYCCGGNKSLEEACRTSNLLIDQVIDSLEMAEQAEHAAQKDRNWQTAPLADLIAEHRALREAGAVHLLATLDGHDVGLLTIEPTSPVPRLCPDGQPYIGPTATLPGARGQGVGHALVDTALTWAHDHGYQWVSVDFDTANPLSRPFWLHAGFRPAGYGVLRLIDGRPAGQPGSAGGH